MLHVQGPRSPATRPVVQIALKALGLPQRCLASPLKHPAGYDVPSHMQHETARGTKAPCAEVNALTGATKVSTAWKGFRV